MRSEFSILGIIFIFHACAHSEGNSFEFDDLTPISITKPKIDVIQPKAATPQNDKDSAPLLLENKEDSSFLSKKEVQDLKQEKAKKDIYAEPLKKAVNALVDSSDKFDLSPSDEAKSIPLDKGEKLDLSPEKPFPIAKPNKELLPKPEDEKKEISKVTDQDPAPRPLGDLTAESPAVPFADSSNSNWALVFVMAFITGLMFLYFWYQKFLRGKMQAHGVDIQVLGQTFLDGQTKIVLLKIGQKVIVMAKSPNFCTTLDIITEPEEINLLTLGSTAAATGEDFSKVLNDLQKQSNKPQRKIPNEREMRTELDQLKEQLSNLQKDA